MNGRYHRFCAVLILWALAVVSSPLEATSSYDPVAVYLTWQRSPESTMTVQWITPASRNQDLVEYRQTPDAPWQQALGSHNALPDASGYIVHKVEITGLSPHTTYTFRTGKDAVEYKFRTMPASDTTPVRFAVGGDMYHDTLEVLRKTNEQAAKQNPDFVLVGGDIAYAASGVGVFPEEFHTWTEWLNLNNKKKRWLEWVISWKQQMVTTDGRLIPMVPALGNHDVNGGFGQTPKQAAYFHTLFAMPGKRGYNVLDFGNYMSIVILDSGHTNPIDGEQTQWLDATLKARQQIPLKYALYHVPAYPSIRKLDSTYCALIRKSWVPLFERYNLTAGFEHHDHNYKRTYPIRKGKIDPTGVLYLGDGAWGVDAPRKRKSSKPIPWYIARIIPSRYFLMVTLADGTAHYTAIDAEGAIIDHTF